MTKDKLVQYVCMKLGQTDSDTVAAAGVFMESRANMIWDAQPWRDTLTVCSVALPNLAQWPSCPWVLMPGQIGKVMKVRFDPSITMASNEPVTWFDMSPVDFEATGTPCKFLQYPPVVCQIAGGGTGTVATDDTVLVNSGGGQDISVTWAAEVERADGTIFTTDQIPLGEQTTLPDGEFGAFILTFTKGITANAVSLSGAGGIIPDSNGVVIPAISAFAASATFAPRVQRIRLSPAPSGAGSILVLGKRAFPGFADGQEFALQNVDNALQDYTLADLLERNRQYGKAQQQATAANSQLQIAFDLETKQAANERRIIPADIGGQDMLYGGFTSKGVW